MPRMTATTSLIAEPLWQRTRASFARAVAAIGAPAMIAAITLLTRDLRRAIVGRLLRLEHITRKLLLAEAAELHRIERERAAKGPRVERVPLRGMAMHWRPGSAAILDRRRIRRPAPVNAGEDAGGSGSAHTNLDRTRPETWRARFSLALPHNPRLVPNSRAPRIRSLWGEYTPPPPAPERAPRVIKQAEAPFRLAVRLEALRRVLANPMPHAQRLARMLAREVKRFPEVVRRYVFAAARTNAYDPDDDRLGVDAYGACIDTPDAFPDSS
jgi:hypothetical protein